MVDKMGVGEMGLGKMGVDELAPNHTHVCVCMYAQVLLPDTVVCFGSILMMCVPIYVSFMIVKQERQFVMKLCCQHLYS